MSFTTQRRFPSIHSLSLRIFIMNGSEILLRNFPLHFIFLFCSVNMVNCIDFFLTIKAALHYWCKLYSIMMYYFFDILLNLIFLKFRVFFIYVHEIYESFSPVQFSRVRPFATPWTAACQASLSITNSRSVPKLMSIESVMPSNHLILCHPLLLLPSIFPNIRVFLNESALCIRWPKFGVSASTSVLPMNTQN